MKKIKVGLLPLYIKLYDDVKATRDYKFLEKVTNSLKTEFDVISADYCTVETEFKTAVKKFEDEGADAIVTLHMAYSPSLESIEALANTKLPLVVMDTTEALIFDNAHSEKPISYNHGIHGVMDMCNLLIRRGKKFGIAAGHLDNSNVLKETCDLVKVSVSANSLKNSKTILFGTSFKGMGDFIVTPKEVKKKFGINLISVKDSEVIQSLNSVTDKEINDEVDYYKQNFIGVEKVDNETLKGSIKASLAVRKIIKELNADAFSVNFLDVKQSNLKYMPFIEACIEMQNGVGYAGEGDALTASFVGALRKTFKEVSFVEIFCPCWKEDLLFISHMGEMNYDVAKEKPVVENLPFIYTDAFDTLRAPAEYKAGKAVFINFFRGANEKFKMIVSDIEFVNKDIHDFDSSIRGWFKPNKPIAQFLKDLSENGAIHHSVVVYNVDINAIKYFGKLLDIEVIEL